MNNTWTPAARFPMYEVNESGLIRNQKTKRVLKTHYKNGYEMVTLAQNKRPKTVRLHRVIAESFYGLDEQGLEVNHIDGNKNNNCIDNLEFCTRKENIQHAMKKGLFKPNNFGHKSKRIRCIEQNIIYSSIRECSRQLNIDQSEMTKFLSGKTNYIPTALEGLHFEFVD